MHRFKNEKKSWLLTQNTSPDFVICGAMKSGTSTLHAILATHPDIYIPDGELHYFDYDNIAEHPDFNYFSHKNNWLSNTAITTLEELANWYDNQFSLMDSVKILGEDSTTYLSSPMAFKRIASLDKPTKVIVILRHPTARTYSQYWHEVRAGRAIYSFEKTLQYIPNSILSRSQYARDLSLLLRYIPRERVKIITFEELVESPQSLILQLCQFLNVDYSKLEPRVLSLHENKASATVFQLVCIY